MIVTEYHEQCTACKELAEEFGYKIGESSRTTDRECKSNGITTTDENYNKKRAGEKYVTQEKFLAALILLGADRHQYGGIMNQLCNNYYKGQHKYPATVQNAQALLTAREGERAPVHGSNDRTSFAKVVSGENVDRGTAGNGDAQEIGG